MRKPRRARSRSRGRRVGLGAPSIAAPGGPDRLRTLDEVAHYLRVSDTTVKRLVYAKRLPVAKIGARGLLRFEEADIKAFVADLIKKSKPES